MDERPAELNVYLVGNTLCYSGVGVTKNLDCCSGARATSKQLADEVYDFAIRQVKILLRSAVARDQCSSSEPVGRGILAEIKSALEAMAARDGKVLAVRVAA
jgi:hypothetical protein